MWQLLSMHNTSFAWNTTAPRSDTTDREIRAAAMLCTSTRELLIGRSEPLVANGQQPKHPKTGPANPGRACTGIQSTLPPLCTMIAAGHAECSHSHNERSLGLLSRPLHKRRLARRQRRAFVAPGGMRHPVLICPCSVTVCACSYDGATSGLQQAWIRVHTIEWPDADGLWPRTERL